jgi:hypothetical protein
MERNAGVFTDEEGVVIACQPSQITVDATALCEFGLTTALAVLAEINTLLSAVTSVADAVNASKLEEATIATTTNAERIAFTEPLFFELFIKNPSERFSFVLHGVDRASLLICV